MKNKNRIVQMLLPVICDKKYEIIKKGKKKGRKEFDKETTDKILGRENNDKKLD